MINAGLWRKEIMEGKKLALSGGGLMLLTAVVLYLAPWPEEWLQQLYETPAGGRHEEMEFAYLVWSVWISRFLLLFSTLAAILLGMKSLAGEVASGTAVFLSSHPLSSRDLVTTKLFSGITLLALAILPSALFFTAVSLYREYWLQLGDGGLNLGIFWGNYLIVILGAAAIYAGAMFFSSLMSHPLPAGLAAVVFWTAAALPGWMESFTGGLAALLPDGFSIFRFLSLFYHLRAPELWMGIPNSLYIHLGAVLVFILIFYELTTFFWGKREL